MIHAICWNEASCCQKVIFFSKRGSKTLPSAFTAGLAQGAPTCLAKASMLPAPVPASLPLLQLIQSIGRSRAQSTWQHLSATPLNVVLLDLAEYIAARLVAQVASPPQSAVGNFLLCQGSAWSCFNWWPDSSSMSILMDAL